MLRVSNCLLFYSNINLQLINNVLFVTSTKKTKKNSKICEIEDFFYIRTLFFFFFVRMLFFRPRLNILIFVPILG